MVDTFQVRRCLSGALRNLRAAEENPANPVVVNIRVQMAREYLDTLMAELFADAATALDKSADVG